MSRSTRSACRLLVLYAVLALLPSTGYAQADTVLNRYREYLFRTNQVRAESVTRWAESLNGGNQWDDVDYRDRSLSAWKTPDHLERIVQLGLAWADPKSPFHKDEGIRRKAVAALDHWLEKRYQNPNWWHNQIGIPQYMRDILVLLREGLTPEQFKQATGVLGQVDLSKPGTGANLTWRADLGLHLGLLTGDDALVQRCRALILSEIKISTDEGIQPDFSYHQHGKRLQIYHYGKAYLTDNLRIAWQLRETSWAFPEEKEEILTGLVLNGWQWMARGIQTVPGTIDRAVSRVGELDSPDLRALIPLMIELRPEQAESFRKLAVLQDENGAPEGFRYYPYSDFAAYHRPGFSFFLKTISPRTLAAESINRENLKGKLLNSGDAYLIRNGREYYDLMPAWDWSALPGVTAFPSAKAIGRKPFTGSVGSGTSGLTAMDYVLEGESGGQALSARKFWACHNDVVVCLLAGLRTAGPVGEVYTALDQSRLQGAVTVNRPGNTLKPGAHTLNKVRWIHHAGFAYIPERPGNISVRLGEATGTWQSINVSQSPATVRDSVFLPRMIHDVSRQESAAYVLALSETPERAEELARNPEWRVLRNDRTIQAVRFSDGAVMAAFFAPGTLRISGKEYVKVDRPCLVLIENGALYASDPTNAGLTVVIDWNGRIQTLKLPADGFSVKAPGF